MLVDSLRLYSEPYGSTGNIGENFRRLLGAPALDALQTVIREAVQNIADAAQLGSGPEIAIRLRTLSAEQMKVMRDTILQELPAEPKSKETIDAFLSNQSPVVLEICDFSTTGLCGPTRADRVPLSTKRTDFVDFLRNIGTPRDTEHGGGTYGFGKVALYRVSRCSTILVDSLPSDGTGRRLIGCHIGSSFDRAEEGMRRRYTGRHWFGVPDPLDGIADPLTGNDAVNLAGALGLPERSDQETGTSIMILDFQTEGETLHELGRRIVETLLWNFWPRMMADTPEERRFKCRVEVESEAVKVPSPESVAPLDLFAKAMTSARSGSGNDVRVIASQRPIKHLGNLAIERGLRSQRHPLVRERSLIPTVSRHIALMRPVELVVKYLEGAPLPDERLEWAGVFIASNDAEVERAFADAEPPAHDDWVPENLPKGHAKTYVNVALRELKSHAFEQGQLLQTSAPGSANAPPLARVAGRLGAALESVGGDGARKRSGAFPGNGSQRPSRARATKPVFVRLQQDEQGRIAVFRTKVQQDSKRTGVALDAIATVAIEGSASDKAFELGFAPSVLCINSPDNALTSSTRLLSIDGAEGTFEISVRMPAECAVTVDARVLRKEEL